MFQNMEHRVPKDRTKYRQNYLIEESSMRNKIAILFVCWMLSVSLAGVFVSNSSNHFYEPIRDSKETLILDNATCGTFEMSFNKTTGTVSNKTAPYETMAIELAKQVFMQTHTEQIFGICSRKSSLFIEYNEEEGTIAHSSDSSYSVFIRYLKTLTYPEGIVTVYYRIRYWVEVETGKVAVDYFTRDVPEGLILRFEGEELITSKEQANQTFLWLIEESPWGKWFRLESPSYMLIHENGTLEIVKSDKPLLEIAELPDHYKVKGWFRNGMVNCPYVYETISYDIYENGTAVIVTPEDGIPS